VAFLVLYQASTKEMGLVEMVRLKIAAMEASRPPYSSSRSGSRSLLHDVDTHIRSGDTLASPGLSPSNSMGLYLQKTNIIIRDYLEDINEIPAPRMF
jgi:hypothetical protein